MVVFIVSGLVIYPRLYKHFPNYFMGCLWLSVIPDAMTQMHMIVGSSTLFDAHFNSAHFLKIVA